MVPVKAVLTLGKQETTMDILKIGAGLLAQKLGGGAAQDEGAVQSALAGALGDGEGMDIAGMLGGLQGGNLAEIAGSWLGDGENQAVSADQVKEMVGSDKISQLAQQLGQDEGSVLSGLQEALPQMVDQGSSGGGLLDSLGGLGGVANLAKGLLK